MKNIIIALKSIDKFQFVEQNNRTPTDVSVGVNYLFSAEQLCLFGPSGTPVPTKKNKTSLREPAFAEGFCIFEQWP